MGVYKTYGINEYIEPGQFIRTARDFKINTFSFSSLCYFIFMTKLVITWRLLDIDSYRIAFPTDKTSYDIAITRMYVMFNHMSEYQDPDSPIK
jgi:hypothetical protein